MASGPLGRRLRGISPPRPSPTTGGTSHCQACCKLSPEDMGSFALFTISLRVQALHFGLYPGLDFGHQFIMLATR